MENQEASELAEQDNTLATRYSTVQAIQQALIEGEAAIEELRILKPVLALAISKLPKQQLKLSLTDQSKLDEWALQAKREEKSGAIVFRAVKA